jgi:L-lactate dehydrogenase complex protein LldF
MTSRSLAPERPDHIGFGEYSQHVPANIPLAVQQATARFLGNRADRIAELPNWEQLRDSAHAIRLHTLQNLDYYLELLEQQVEKAGGKVYWAVDSAQAREIVLHIAKEHQVKSIVKVKSMATEEIGLNHALEAEGISTYETDLGEFIIQLAGTGPSHIIIPAVHLKKEEIAKLFKDKLGVDAPTDPIELAGIAREFLRQKFLKADMGISGANFMVAETGTLTIVTNEGNGRMCTTLPDLHVAVVGIDKVIPDWESLSVLLQLLARSATGQKLSAYTSFISGPSRSASEGGPKEFHLILLDNGRSRILADPIARETLKCIRCGCCLNICPVYKSVGGYAYGWFISGPIGAIFSPQILGGETAKELPFASSLCGACADVCPVKIPIPNILLHLRHRVVEGDQFEHATAPGLINTGAKFGGFALNQSWLYRLGTRLLPSLQVPLKRNGWIPALPAPLNRWTKVRPLPAFRGGFRQWWPEHRNRLDKKSR